MMNVCVCLLVFALGSNVAADLIKVVLNERESVTVPCPRPVDGDVTWSRDTNGVRRDILRVVGDRDVKLVCDPFRRFSSLANKSLHIFKAVVSDTATYFCNNEAAAELTVFPRDLIKVVLNERESVTVPCPRPVDGDVTWSRDMNGVRRDILRVVGDRDVKLVSDPFRRFSSLADKSLHIFKAVVSDTATYFCNNELAVELTVIPRDSFVVAAAEKTTVVLLCPPDVGGSDVATWSRDVAGKGKREFIVNCTECRLTAGLNTLTIRNLQPDHAGLYFCDGKPAAYLNVTAEQRTDGGETRGRCGEERHV